MKKLITLDNFFLVIIFCMPLYLIRVNIFGVPSNVFEVLALTATILGTIRKRETFSNKLAEFPRLFLASIALILVGTLISIFFSNDHRAGFGILKGWFLVPIFFSFVLYVNLNHALTVEKIFQSIYFSTIFVGFIAILYKLFGITTYDNRLSAFYLSPNHLSMYLAPGIFFGLYFLSKSFLRDRFSKQLFFYSSTLLLLLIPLYCTYSYGAWIAVLISLLMTLTIARPIKKQLLLTVLFLFIFSIVLFVSQMNTQKFLSASDVFSRSSLASRQTIWQVSLLLVKQHPLTGIGPGNFQSSYLSLQPYFPPYLEWAVPEPHNILLAFWLQTGLLGFVGFLMLLFFTFKRLWMAITDKKNVAFATLLLGFFLYTFLHGMIDTPYWKNDLSFLFWVCIFLTLFLNNSFSKKDFL